MEQYKPYTYEDFMAASSEFVKEGRVNRHDLRDINAVCGCSSSSCIEKRYIKTEKKEVFDVVKMINGKITIVINDVVIKVKDNKVDVVEDIVTIESNKKGFSI